MLPLDLYARVRVLLCAIAHETAGASRHPVFPAPSFQEEGNEVAKPRASAPRDRGGVDNDRHSNTTNVQGTTAAAAQPQRSITMRGCISAPSVADHHIPQESRKNAIFPGVVVVHQYVHPP
jgi:hypothetical protein